LPISVRLRNLIRGGQSPIWAEAPLEEEDVKVIKDMYGTF
jgi:hypothetical protein